MDFTIMVYKALALVVAAGVLHVVPAFALQPAEKAAAPAAQPTAQPTAQPIAPPAPPPPPAPVVKPAPVWSDPEMEKVAQSLTGSWKSNAPIPTDGAADATTDVVMSIVPVVLADVPNALYSEVAHTDALNRPYRQAIWQLHRAGGKVRLKTYELRRRNGRMESLYGMWLAPELFPELKMGDLVATLDIVLNPSAGGFTGTTLHPYPTATGGALEMTSDISVAGDTLKTADRGLGADGKIVWGPAKGKEFAFTKFEPSVKVTRLEGGVVVIDYSTKFEGEVAKAGEMMTVDYAGFTEDGNMFDSSFERGQPFKYSVGQPLIEGWNRAMANAQKGMVRRLVIPGPLAYGERGNPRAKIAPNATLIFDITVHSIEPPPPPPEPVAPPAPPQGEQPAVDPQMAAQIAEKERLAKEKEAAKAAEDKAHEGHGHETPPPK